MDPVQMRTLDRDSDLVDCPGLMYHLFTFRASLRLIGRGLGRGGMAISLDKVLVAHMLSCASSICIICSALS